MNIKLKRNDKIGLTFFLAFIISMSLIWLFEERFEADRWRSNPGKRYQMAKNIIEEDLLNEKSRDEVIQLLGIPKASKSTDINVMVYELGTPPSFFDAEPQQLVIRFLNGKVRAVAVVQD